MATFARCALLMALVGLLSVAKCFGTHIVAGEISNRQDAGSGNPNTYAFTLKVHGDVQGPDQPYATLDFGVAGINQSLPVGLRQKVGVLITNEIGVLVYDFKYTYPGPGTYAVSFTEENRNAGIVNMFQSVNTPFHLETTLTIGPASAGNRSP